MDLPQSEVAESLRHRLSIPDEAEHVLIFTESSHWDPNWVRTSESYFDRFVQSNLDAAITALQAEPRRIYSIECVFFLRLYWDRCPEQRESIRALVNSGRMRLTGSGVTTADTLLPDAEALLRDFLLGQEWLRANGMTQVPTLEYFADSFGASPALPSLLRAAGFDRTAITRVDGMSFIGSDLESAKRFPRPGTTAEQLLNEEGSLDFIWRDANGAEVLCHWNAFTYGQGDMLAYRGLSRVYLVRFAFPDRSDRLVARRIREYVEDLGPLSRTPYMLCPIGFDFVEPIPDLVALLDRYNRNHYPETGVWTVNAGLDDYMTLIDLYRDTLPVLALDPNPYWTGFYAARPTLKARCHKLVDDLLLAERLSLVEGDVKEAQQVSEDLSDAWWSAAVSNHHDFITGTSPDEVVEQEQLPWLRQAQERVDGVLARLAGSAAARTADRADRAVGDVSGSGTEGLAWQMKGGRLTVETPHYVVQMSEADGGSIVSCRTPDNQTARLGAASNDLVTYRDSGGLWRMGYEFRGGTWQSVRRASDGQAEMEACEDSGVLEVVSTVLSGDQMLRRHLWFDPATPLIRCRAEGIAPTGHTMTIRFSTGLSVSELTMDTPGGVVVRSPKRYYDPTFWPFQHFVHLQDHVSGIGLALLQRLPGAVSVGPAGTVELVAFRNATHEVAYGLIGLPAYPAHGHESEAYAFDYALLLTSEGDWAANGVLRALDTLTDCGPWDQADSGLRDLANSIVTTDAEGVRVTAVKVASRGEGLIVRLAGPLVPVAPVTVRCDVLPLGRAFLCDARERDLAPLDVVDGAVSVEMSGTLATLRLLR